VSEPNLFVKMRLKLNYLVIPFMVALVAGLGSFFNLGPENWVWYESLNQPSLTPPNWVFPVVWNTIWLMATISIILIWNNKKKSLKKLRDRTISLFIINGVLNAAWSLLFFSLHKIEFAFVDILLLEITNIALVILSWKISKPASTLLWLYTGWVGFAAYLNYQYLILN